MELGEWGGGGGGLAIGWCFSVLGLVIVVGDTTGPE